MSSSVRSTMVYCFFLDSEAHVHHGLWISIACGARALIVLGILPSSSVGRSIFQILPKGKLNPFFQNADRQLTVLGGARQFGGYCVSERRKKRVSRCHSSVRREPVSPT